MWKLLAPLRPVEEGVLACCDNGILGERNSCKAWGAYV